MQNSAAGLMLLVQYIIGLMIQFVQGSIASHIKCRGTRLPFIHAAVQNSLLAPVSMFFAVEEWNGLLLGQLLY